MLGHDISLLELNKEISETKSAFIFGNGFSINFDKGFSQIYDNLYEAHKELLRNAQYKVKSNQAFKKKCLDNYKSVIRYLRYFSEKDFMKLFEDAALFADSILKNNRLIDEFWEDGIISRLTFGLSEIEPLNEICKISKEKGFRYVNIEHWTILIYFFAAINKKKPDYYEFPNDNSFVLVLKHGEKNKTQLAVAEGKYNWYEAVIFNGFTIYFKMLFSIAIFAKGKAVTYSKLENSNNINLNGLSNFLNNFDLLLSLNYDRIMHDIQGEKVEHLHGEFVLNKEEYVYYQSYGLRYEDGYVSFSDILIGDYFIFKSYLPIVNNLSSSKDFINKLTDTFSDKIDNLTFSNKISTALIFGMNIENDYHVLRNLMLAFYESGVKQPKIIYSYFNEKEKIDFDVEFEKVITFREDVSDYCRNIKVSYVKTQDILADYFYKKTEETDKISLI